MKILIVTPLFPPDTAPSALYSKTLANELGKNNQVEVLLYGDIPESCDNANLYTISKNNSLPFRLLAFTSKLIRLAKHQDLILIQNGASVELPALIASLVNKTTSFLQLSDNKAEEKISTNRFYESIHESLIKKVAVTLDNSLPETKPEILPFEPYPQNKMEEYERSWSEHIQEINNAYASCK